MLVDVVAQHAEECAFLWSQRSALRAAPDVHLRFFSEHDERLSAHLEGLALAGEAGVRECDTNLATPNPGAIFASTVLALERAEMRRLERLMQLAGAEPAAVGGMISAFGWTSPSYLQRTVKGLLSSAEATAQAVGVAACAVHRIDPGLNSHGWVEDDVPALRARALRATGELGVAQLHSVCASASRDRDPESRFWGTWSSVLLGNRRGSLDCLVEIAAEAGGHQTRAFRLALQAMHPTAAHEWLKAIARDRQRLRWVIQGSGLVGDPSYGPWLIKQMESTEMVRLAGEAFSLITGVDLGSPALEGVRPQGFQSGPNEDPSDSNVDMDPDEGLPWPDVDKVQTWWEANKSRFTPGQRYFMGAPVTREHCIEVLKTGYQRQRILAAHYLCLLEPGTRLFNTSAPAWRQQRLLAQMK